MELVNWPHSVTDSAVIEVWNVDVNLVRRPFNLCGFLEQTLAAEETNL